jgi:hypothetical protein
VVVVEGEPGRVTAGVVLVVGDVVGAVPAASGRPGVVLCNITTAIRPAAVEASAAGVFFIPWLLRADGATLASGEGT